MPRVVNSKLKFYALLAQVSAPLRLRSSQIRCSSAQRLRLLQGVLGLKALELRDKRDVPQHSPLRGSVSLKSKVLRFTVSPRSSREQWSRLVQQSQQEHEAAFIWRSEYEYREPR